MDFQILVRDFDKKRCLKFFWIFEEFFSRQNEWIVQKTFLASLFILFLSYLWHALCDCVILWLNCG